LPCQTQNIQIASSWHFAAWFDQKLKLEYAECVVKTKAACLGRIIKMQKAWIVVLFALGSLFALAQMPPPNWQEFDANKDGRFDKSDLLLLFKNNTPQSDANRDGKFDIQDEIEILISLSVWDKNADARVDASDFVAVQLEQKAADAAGLQKIVNGILGSTELKNIIEAQLTKEWTGLARGSNVQQGRLYLQAATLAALRRQDAVALYLYAQAVFYTPQAVPALNGLGFFLGQRGRLQDALHVLLAARGLDNRNCETYNNLGWVLARAGLSTASLESYTQSALLCPEIRQYRQNKAIGQLRMGQRAQAASSLASIPDVALSGLMNQSNQSTQEFDTAWNEEAKQYPPIAGDIDSHLTAVARIEFYIRQILVKNSAKYYELELSRRLESLKRANILSSIMKLPHTSREISESQSCENTKHYNKTYPIALEMIKRMAAEMYVSGLELRRTGTVELGNSLVSAESRFRAWIAQDIASIKRLEKDPKKAQVWIDSLLELTKDFLLYGRRTLAWANSKPISLDTPMHYFHNPPVNFNTPQDEFARIYFQEGIYVRPAQVPVICGLKAELQGTNALPLEYLLYLLEYLGNSILSNEFALDIGVVGVSVTPSEGEYKIRAGEGVFAEGLWNPKTGYGFNLGVGGAFKQSFGPLKIDVQAKVYLNYKSNGANSLIAEVDFQKNTDLFKKSIGDVNLEGSKSKSLWNPDVEIELSPASHEPVLSISDVFGF
jgi:hypothetical protein